MLAFHRLRQAVLLLVLAVAMSAAAFAHRPLLPQDAGLALVLSMGATAADLCSDGAPGEGLSGDHCLACLIAGSACLPAPATNVPAGAPVAPDGGLAPQRLRTPAAVRDPAHGPQGPPAA
jgi:hypothetical protein